MATGSDAASRGSDETLSSGNEPWTEKSTRAWAIWAGGESSAAMVKGLFEVRGSRHSWRDDARGCWELSRGGLDAAEALPHEPFVRLGISLEDGNVRVSRFKFGGTRCCPLSFVVNHLALLPPSSSSVPGQRVTCLEAVANWKPPKAPEAQPLSPTRGVQEAPHRWNRPPQRCSWRQLVPRTHRRTANICPAHKTAFRFSPAFFFSLSVTTTTTTASPVTMSASKKETPRTGLAAVSLHHFPAGFSTLRDPAASQSLCQRLWQILVRDRENANSLLHRVSTRAT